MTMHYYTGRSRKQEPEDHCLVGYDPVSERAKFAVKIPKSESDLLRKFVHFEPDDPEGYDSYKLQYSNVEELSKLLGLHSKPPKELEYFVEPWVPEEHDTSFE